MPPREGRDDREAFPSPAAKAAALLQSIVTMQPFVDGNQRTAWVACRTFLMLNGLDLRGTASEVKRLLLDVRRAVVSLDDLREWIEKRIVAST